MRAVYDITLLTVQRECQQILILIHYLSYTTYRAAHATASLMEEVEDAHTRDAVKVRGTNSSVLVMAGARYITHPSQHPYIITSPLINCRWSV